ncbi:MAG: MMPL family transporter [Hylemonella sp.]|uniref:MMPL family transporter n=1 Tax=Hylemonella sp. TaxID=2066020 RepID=UPI0022CC6F4D|nr:MMPL family transporter [Hylemonella sp.]MCZ8251440.1 MMPL family transporter [Hylemonella sp.]
MHLLRRHLPILLWLAVLAGFGAVILRTPVVTDLSAFMPSAPSERQQMLVDQFKEGIIARLIIVGIEGGDAAERARLSRALADSLRPQTDFIGVQNGSAEEQARDRHYFFENRYLLSPAVTPERYSEPGLRDAIGATLADISGSAGMLIKQLLPRDPTGEIRELLAAFEGGEQPPSTEGVWSTRDGSRALLLLQTRAEGSDLEAQARALAAVQRTFDAIPQRQADTRLLMTGTGVFSVQSRGLIQGEVRRLAIASLVLVVGLLWLVYRSWRLLGLNLLPMLTGTLAGITAVGLVYGEVHGITLGFGTTMIGEAVDYAIYLFVQRPGPMAQRAFWRTLWLGLLTSVAGFLALLGSGFPGLVQLGLYSTAGLLAAVLVTRYVLPQLMPAQLPAIELPRTGAFLQRAVQLAPRLRGLLLLFVAGMLAVVALRADSIWNRSISALNPVPRAAQQLDEELRRDLGASELRYLAVLTAPDAEQGLQQSERASRVLQALSREGVLAGHSAPSQVLPSRASQQARQAALPEATELRRRLATALAGQPLKPERLQGFVDDAERNRTRPLLTRADLEGTAAALLYDTLLVQRERDVLVLLPLRPMLREGESVLDLDRIDAALHAEGLAQATVIDLLAETNALFDSYLHEALVYSGLGCLAILAILLFMLRSLVRALRVALPLVCAVLGVTGALLLAGTALTILHLVGLLLVVAIGSNYALFFDSSNTAASPQQHRLTLISLVTANLTIVGSFGMLALSSVPVLTILGVTVGLGTMLALLFSAILAQGAISRPPVKLPS